MKKERKETEEEKIEMAKEAIAKKYRALCGGSDMHCDIWRADEFRTSLSGKIMAYRIHRKYFTLRPGVSDYYHGIGILDVGSGKEISKTLMDKYDMADAIYPSFSFSDKRKEISKILSVSDERKVKYLTEDGLEHVVEV